MKMKEVKPRERGNVSLEYPLDPPLQGIILPSLEVNI